MDGAADGGADVRDLGMVGTKMVYFAVGDLGLDGVIDHLRPDHPEIAHVGATVGSTVHHGGGHRRRPRPHVPPDAIAAGSNCSTYAPPDRVGAFLVELPPVDAADVVGLEDPRASTPLS